MMPLVNFEFLGHLLFFLFYFLLLSSGIPFLIKYKRSFILFLLFLTPVILLFSEFFSRSKGLKICADLFMAFYCVSLGAIILIRTFTQKNITIYRVQGGLIVYMLVSLFFALLYHVLYLIYGMPAFHGLTTGLRTEFMYFSFSALTTAGYGDITPVSSVARSLSNLESLTGQLFPSILIARLVSLQFSKSANQATG
jgi:Ion channel